MAVSGVVLAVALRLLMVPMLGRSLPPYATFAPVVMLVAILVGFWPTVLTILLSALVVFFTVLPPTGQAPLHRASHLISITFFVSAGLLLNLAAELYRRGQRRSSDTTETQLRLFIEHAPAALAMFDREMRYMRVSNRWLADYGLGTRDVVGRLHYEVFPEMPAHWKDFHRRALAGEVQKSEGDCFLREDGSSQWLRWEIHPWRTSRGQVGGVLIFTEDITERRLTEVRLQRITRTYAVLTDINQTIVRETDRTAMLAAACRIAVDKSHFKMAWIGAINPVSRRVQALVSSGDVDGYLESAVKGSTTEQQSNSPVALVFRSGRHVVSNDVENDPIYKPWRDKALQRGYRSAAAFPLKLDGEVIGAFMLYASDVGFFDEEELELLDEMTKNISFAMAAAQREVERRKVEEELRSRTAFFEALMESSMDGIMVKDEGGQVIFRNRRFAKVWKMPESIAETDEGTEHVKFALSQAKNPELLIRNTERIYAHPDQVSQDEVELRDGTCLTRYTSPVRDRLGKYYGRIWTFQDITERRQLERQLRQSQKMEAVGQLTGGIAHDFNNILAIIQGNLGLLDSKLAGDESALRRIRIALKASQRGADVTRRLLAFSRVGELKPTRIDLRLSVANVVGFAQTLGPDIRFVLQFEDAVPFVNVDASALENALLNLMVNSRDAMPSGGSVTIATQRKCLDDSHPLVKVGELKAGTHACILISDTGQGMSTATLERVFEPFFTTKQQGKGTGLGLSMVSGFVKQSGGAVRMYSEPGHGTSVSIYLPSANVETPEEIVPAFETRTAKRTAKVLVVDDEPDLIDIAEAYLEAMGYEVSRALGPEEALEIARQQSDLELMFTDIIMPGGMNGVELAHRVRQLIPKIEVVYSSGYPANAMADRGLPPIDGKLLRKPYQRAEFEAAIFEALK